jgi:hypothetical protein
MAKNIRFKNVHRKTRPAKDEADEGRRKGTTQQVRGLGMQTNMSKNLTREMYSNVKHMYCGRKKSQNKHSSRKSMESNELRNKKINPQKRAG